VLDDFHGVNDGVGAVLGGRFNALASGKVPGWREARRETGWSCGTGPGQGDAIRPLPPPSPPAPL